ncbi:MAG: hypothetical protein JXQ83_13495 [Candidatus Glassbacteria bacterium]|nr:hypothetical protein [Candidatus Glassbacteria bacterium]
MISKAIKFIIPLVLLPALLPATSTYTRPAWAERGMLVWGGNLHEPLAFYRRENRPMAGVEAQGLWLEDWYEKVRSEETIRELAGMGANVLYLNFAKGAGGNEEFEDLERAARVAELCHRLGIRVLAYIQFASKHTEEFPGARRWQALGRDGRPLIYGDRYYRAVVCPLRPGYLDYLKSLIRNAVVDYGMDGVFLDNCYYDGCYCEHCQESFRAFLKENFPDPLGSLGIASLDSVRIPEVQDDEALVTDRLQQAWLDWRVSVIPAAADSLRSYTKRLDPDAAFCGNIIYPRMNNWHLRGVDPYRMMRIFDVPYAEGHNFPRWEDGIAVNNAPTLIMGCGAGSNVVPGVWLPGTVLPGSGDQVELALGESLAFGGHVLAGIWALRMKGRRFARSAGELAEPYFTREEVAGPWARYNGFLLRNRRLYHGSELVSPLALYHSEKSMAYDFGTAYPAFVNAAQALLQSQTPFDILFSQDVAGLGRYKTLLVCSQRCLSESEIAAFGEFVASGGSLVVTGESGLFDQCRRERPDYGLAGLIGASLFDSAPRRVYRKSRGRGRVVFFRCAAELEGVDVSQTTVRRAVPPRLLEVVDSVRSCLKGSIPVRVAAPSCLGTCIFRTSGGDTVLHLLNYDNRSVLEDISLGLPAGSPLRLSRPRACSPDGAAYENLEQESADSWVLPRLKTYTCILWE